MDHYCIECNTRKVNKQGQRCPECQKREDKKNREKQIIDRDTRKVWHTNDWLRSLGEK